jgi:hypothetical protein
VIIKQTKKEDNKMIKFSVTKGGNVLDSSLYTWEENTKTFSTKEDGLVLDFSSFTGVTFNTGKSCIFKTSYKCKFYTGDYCIFVTGYGCTFKTGSYCTFYTCYDCTFNTGSDCKFYTCSDCSCKNDLICKEKKL